MDSKLSKSLEKASQDLKEMAESIKVQDIHIVHLHDVIGALKHEHTHYELGIFSSRLGNSKQIVLDHAEIPLEFRSLALTKFDRLLIEAIKQRKSFEESYKKFDATRF